MRKALVLTMLVVALGLALPAMAGDVVDMPTGNMVPPGSWEFNYIFWDLDTPPGPAPDHINIFEGFFGVTDWLELDAIVADVENDDTYVKFNAYGRVIPETPKHPGLIFGVTNFTGNDWPGNDNPSPFILSSFNLHVPAGPPDWSDPLVRAHLAYGWEFHEEKLFGGLQFLFQPWLGGAIFSYQGDPSYVIVVRPKKLYELRAGWKDEQPFYSLGLFGEW